MRFLVTFCLFQVAEMEPNLKLLPRFYLPAEQIKHVDEQNYKSVETRDLVDCSYHNGQFLCKDKRKCIDLIDTCDDECNCWDCSDESDECWKYDENVCQSCYHLCLQTPHGSMCFCNNETYKSSFVCQEIYECGPDAPCDQKCVTYEGIERCSCGENYRAKPKTRGQKCISDVSHDNLLLYSTNDEIKLFNFTANGAFVIRNDIKCKGLSGAHNHFYYGTAEKNTGYVHRTSMVTGETDLIIETYSPIIFSIDVDWITGNIYFSTDQSLGVCSKEGKFCALIKSVIVSDSCHLSLAPRSGLLFYSLGSIPFYYQYSQIMKSSMDGSDDTVLFTRNLRHPIALTVDEMSEKVYWIDCDLGEIHSIQFNGKNWKVLFADSQTHIFTISKFESNMFWTEESKNTIGLNFERKTKFLVDKNATSVKYLHAYNPVLQRIKMPNPCTNSTCNGLCLLRPSSSKGLLNFTCLCDNITSSSRKHWCNKPSAPVKWQFETDFEYEIQPPQSERRYKSTHVTLSVAMFSFLIILTSVSVYLIIRRRVLYRCFDRTANWSEESEELMPLMEL